jgi:hypothetical protein
MGYFRLTQRPKKSGTAKKYFLHNSSAIRQPVALRAQITAQQKRFAIDLVEKYNATMWEHMALHTVFVP